MSEDNKEEIKEISDPNKDINNLDLDVEQKPIKEENVAEPVPVNTDDGLEDNYTSSNEEIKEEKETPILNKERTPRTKITKPVSEDLKEEPAEYICLPPDLQNQVIKTLTDADRLNLEGTEETRDWGNVLRDGLDHNTEANIFVSNLDNEKASFDNEIKHNNLDLGIKTPVFNKNNLKGEQAIFRTIQELDIGAIKTIPLFNSGFHIIIKPCTDIELLELNRRVVESKIQLGSSTKGLVYSSTTYYMIDCIIDFIKDHIYNTTIILEPGEDIMDYIVAQDIFDLIWGMLCAMYPSGFNYRRACSAKPAECHYVASGILNLQECQLVNKNALTDWQKTFMSKTQRKSKTKEEVKRYQDELTCMSKRSITLKSNDKVTINMLLEAPTVNEYINSGSLWVTTIADKINEMMTNISPEKREEFILESGRATALRQYAHYVSAIEEVRTDGTNTHTDTDTINNYLNILSSDSEVRNTFFRSVTDYISKSTVSVIGIPVYTCPSCNKDQNQGTDVHGEEFTEVIPLDMLTCFFSLLTQKISRISLR